MVTAATQFATIGNLRLPFVELSFGVIGQALPADHGYGLYSAIVQAPPELVELVKVEAQTMTQLYREEV